MGFDGIEGKRSFVEYRGCIEIYENVFIGAGARILPDVSIEPNAIIAAGAVVTKDVPPNSVVGGVPARVIGRFDDVMIKRKEWSLAHKDDYSNERLWKEFYESRG